MQTYKHEHFQIQLNYCNFFSYDSSFSSLLYLSSSNRLFAYYFYFIPVAVIQLLSHHQIYYTISCSES